MKVYTQDDIYNIEARVMTDTTRSIRDLIERLWLDASKEADDDESIGYAAGVAAALDIIDHPADYQFNI